MAQDDIGQGLVEIEAEEVLELPPQLLALLPEEMTQATLICVIAIVDALGGGDTVIPPHCALSEIEFVDRNGNGLLDFRLAIDPNKLPARS